MTGPGPVRPQRPPIEHVLHCGGAAAESQIRAMRPEARAVMLAHLAELFCVLCGTELHPLLARCPCVSQEAVQ